MTPNRLSRGLTFTEFVRVSEALLQRLDSNAKIATNLQPGARILRGRRPSLIHRASRLTTIWQGTGGFLLRQRLLIMDFLCSLGERRVCDESYAIMVRYV